jgi:hypothetical protein
MTFQTLVWLFEVILMLSKPILGVNKLYLLPSTAKGHQNSNKWGGNM